MKRNEYNRLLAEFGVEPQAEFGVSFKAAKAARKKLVTIIAALPRRNETSAYIALAPLHCIAGWIMDARNYSDWSEARWDRRNGI